MKRGITVLVCTYNGASRIPETLAHLSHQQVNNDLNWEIIIIDNASTDQTNKAAAKEWSKYNLPEVGFSIIIEDKPGKINALETGAMHAKYEYLVICDDDNWLSQGYLQTTIDVLDADPQIGATGGQSFAINDTGIFPAWFEEYQYGYAVGQQGSVRGDVTSRGYLFGAGLGTRTKLYLDIYKDHPSFLIGRQGEKLSAGEDNEYCQRLILRGYKLYYEPNLVFQHYMPQNRLEESYRKKLFTGFDESNKVLDKYNLITKLSIKLKKNPLNWLRLLILAPVRILFGDSKENELNILRYLLNIRAGNDEVFNEIIKFKKTAVSNKLCK